MKRDRETQKYCGLLNTVHCFTIYYQNKRHETDITFKREKEKFEGSSPSSYCLPLPSIFLFKLGA